MNTYRPDIDGLRGLSVLIVMLYHAQIAGFAGGFIGVDVFFVISGYLITSIILSDLNSGSFSFVTFIERRVRRILPALLVVILVSIPFAIMWLLPDDRENFLRSALAAAFFFSNVFFYLDSGYFSAANELKPLMHTWSLAIEEQFYLAYPLVILVCIRWLPTRIFHVVSFLFLLSLISALSLGPRYPDASFFLPVTRAWQLMIGALLAFRESATVVRWGKLRKVPASRASSVWFAEAGALIAIFILLASTLLLDGESPFLLRTMVPSIASIIIISVTPKTAIAKALLGWRPLVSLGLVSYSAYLWHQPILAFARHRLSVALPVIVAISCLVLALIIAYASVKFIERPFRDRDRTSRKRLAMSAIGGSILVLLVTVLSLRLSDGLDHLLGRDALYASLSSNLKVPYGLNSTCRFGPSDDPRCRSSVNPNVLLWGDSNAMQLANGLDSAEDGVFVWQATRPGCGPFVGIAPRRGNDTDAFVRDCIQDSKRLFEMIGVGESSLRTAVLSSSFWRYLDPEVDIVSSGGSVRGGLELAEAYLMRSVDSLQSLGMRVFIVSPAPQSGANLGRCVANAKMFDREIDRCDFSLTDSSPRYQAALRLLRRLESRGYEVIFLEDVLCNAGRCVVSLEGEALYADESHLSNAGVALVGRLIRSYIATNFANIRTTNE
jgi:peptidoglycan/LPS O-acetylase OafA/YrhL